MPVSKEAHDDWRRKRSEEQIARGDLPLNAEWRLRRLTEGRRLFTSALSVGELALTGALGIRPLGQVTGSSIFHVGWQPTGYYMSTTLDVVTAAHTKARRLALTRVQTEAIMLGAQGVVGVRLETRAFGGDENVLEVTATGTAVGWRSAHTTEAPFLCGFSGLDLGALYAAGYFPVGIALGTCAYYQVGSPVTTQVVRGGIWNSEARRNMELGDYTRGLTQARHHAVHQMENDATYLRADGVLAVGCEKNIHVHEAEIEVNEQKIRRRDLVVLFSVLGTAVQEIDAGHCAVHPVLPLGA